MSKKDAKQEPSIIDLQQVAMAAEITAVRREYVQLLRLCNAVQLSFIALARSLNVDPKQLAAFIANESANRAYEADASAELSKIRDDMANAMKIVAES